MNTVKISPYKEAAFYRKLIAEHGSPLLLLDARVIQQQYLALKKALAEVEIFYAVKSLPHQAVISLLADMGAGFDIASTGEIKLVSGIPFSQWHTIHTHPIKRDEDIREALRFGCTTFVVDNKDELYKFLPYKYRVGLMLRVSFRSHAAVVDLSKKFGCAKEDAPELLNLAVKLGIHIKGLSFHVGSQCGNAVEQVKAIQICNRLIRSHYGNGAAPISMLDIGGGFPIDYSGKQTDIITYCAPIRKALRALPHYVSVIAEPGRFLVGPSMSCVTSIIGKAIRSGHHWYYLDDGIYGSFSGQIFDHMRYPLEVFSNNTAAFESVLAGPTCDSIDVVAEGLRLPELQIGDIIVGHMMGAYTAASATDFNSLKKAKIVVLNSEIASQVLKARLAAVVLPSKGRRPRILN